VIPTRMISTARTMAEAGGAAAVPRRTTDVQGPTALDVVAAWAPE
jgi:hypothetical protein